MGFGTILSLLWTVVSRGVSGKGIGDTADKLLSRIGDLRDAESEVEKAEIERDIVQIKAVRDLQMSSSRKLLSPMMLGQYLIVVPYGLWWAAIFFVSTFGKNLGLDLVVDDIPTHIFDEARWLIPLIIVGTFLEGKR